MNPVLVEVMRGDRIESRHCGIAIAVDADGTVLFAAGDAVANVIFCEVLLDVSSALGWSQIRGLDWAQAR